MKLFTRKVGRGSPLVILHGLFGMSDNWMTLSKRFAEEGFEVFAPDARNHGQSPWTDDFNYEVMAEDVLQLMNGVGIERASVIGHSMGGKTAMYFACEHPSKVEKLIVVDMSPRVYAIANKDVIAAMRGIDLKNISSRKEAEVSLRDSLHDETTVQFLLKSLYWKGERLAWRFNLDAIEKNIERMCDGLPDNYYNDGPTLFLRGDNSSYISDNDTPMIKKHFPKATITTISNAGHWIHAENPQGFTEAVLKFLLRFTTK